MVSLTAEIGLLGALIVRLPHPTLTGHSLMRLLLLQAAHLRPAFNDTADYLFLNSNFGL